ncbi:hypothetical protein RND81_13G175200 [Saponaria officinalis]|uniref:Uncharacterized protein n=1 Tax=Saponaria officinalis TaxID=3572 RepID=A0AAW1H4C1_SAPOF
MASQRLVFVTLLLVSLVLVHQSTGRVQVEDKIKVEGDHPTCKATMPCKTQEECAVSCREFGFSGDAFYCEEKVCRCCNTF